MKVFVLFCVVVLGSSVIAQEDSMTTVVPPPIVLPSGNASRSACNNGTVTSDDEDFVGDINQVDCDFSKGNSCQSYIQVTSDGRTIIDRQCKQTEACENNAKVNGGTFNRCYPGENGIRQCWFCCATHLCNDFTEIPPEA